MLTPPGRAERNGPSNEVAEAAVLGALLSANDWVEAVAAIITEDDFAEPVHARIFAAITEAVSQGRGANPVLFRHKFENDPALKDLGGAGYLVRLTGAETGGAGLLNPLGLAAQIREMADLRRILAGADEVATACEQGAGSPSEILAKLQDLVQAAQETAAFGSLETLDLAALADVRPTAKLMAIERLAPVGEVTLFTGPGSAGKSLAGQQVCTAAAAGERFLGLTVIAAPALYMTCEDDGEQLHWRQSHICEVLGASMASLAGRLHLISRRGELDNALATFGPDGRLTPTAAYHRLRAKIITTGAKIVCLDNVAHLFPGNENDRGEVTAFVNLLNRLAGETGAAILLIAHPNKGRADYSGSTAWLNSLRSHITLDFERDDTGEIPDPDTRVLAVGKANYSRKGDALRFRWHEWAFVRDEDLSSDVRAELDETIRASADNRIFIACLAERMRQKRPVSEKRSPSYAPSVFAKMPESKNIGQGRLEQAMDRLFRTGEIERAELWKGADRKPVFGLRKVAGDGAGDGAVNTMRETRETVSNPAEIRAGDAGNTHPISKDIGDVALVGPTPPLNSDRDVPVAISDERN